MIDRADSYFVRLPVNRTALRIATVAAWLILALLSAFASPDPEPRVIFIKEFPGSRPDYYSITVSENGRTVYRTAPDDDSPLQFQLPPDTAAEIFRLAGQLNWFKGEKLESGRKVANMGKKTLEYAKGEENYEASFNHTERPEAMALMGIFEKISQTEQHILQLKYLTHFDKLGVMKELLAAEIDFDQGRLIGADQLEPVLTQIQNDRSLVHVAQERAAEFLNKIKTSAKN